MTVITNADYRKRIERETNGFHVFTERRPRIGSKRVFVYPHWGTPDSHPAYTNHRFHVVKVVSLVSGTGGPRHGPNDDYSEPMFHIIASDGWRGMAFASELFPMPKGRLS